MTQRHITYLLLFIVGLIGSNASVIHAENQADGTPINAQDSTVQVSKKPKISQDAIKSNVEYSAKDSVVFYADGHAFLYGNAKVTYEKMELTSDHIEMNTDSTIVHARCGYDSTGAEIGRPIFKDGNESYESHSIDFNYETKKGIIHNVVTQQGDGFVTSNTAKKLEDNTFLMKDGKYTTCDDHEHPHFYLNLTQAKVKPKEYIVAGPAYLVIEDVPLPLALPFGFFPFTEKYSSGLLMPTFGEETSRGFYLRNGGYYFAINQYFDLALRADIYTKGSWGVNATTRYKKRYKFNGNIYLSYQSTAQSEKDMPDYTQTNDMKVTWTHTQDPKANPFRTFSASVNFSSTSYNKNNTNAHYNPSAYGENNKSSSINYTYRFPESHFSLTTNVTLNQRQSDSTLSLKLPTFHLNMSRVYPFKKEKRSGKEKWFEKIYLNYSMNIDNYISTKQDKLFEQNILKDWNNGIKNQANLGASYTAFKYFVITPSFNYTEKWYFKKKELTWNEADQKTEEFIKNGFYRINDMNASLNVSTQLYGFFQPIIGKKISMIRHVFQPSASLSFTPKMEKPFPSFGQNYYDNYYRFRKDGSIDTTKYCYYTGNYYGGPSSDGGGFVHLSVNNNLEMKVRTDKDTTGYKKISLIDNLSLSTSYKMFTEKDETPWSDISAGLRLKFPRNLYMNITAGFCPYTYKLNENGQYYKSTTSEMERNGRIARLTNARTSFNYSFSNNTFKRKSNKKEDEEIDYNAETVDDMLDEVIDNPEKQQKDSRYDEDGYFKYKLPWNVNVSYSISYGDYLFNKEKLEFEQRLSQTLNFSGGFNFSENWTFSISSGYDFINKEMSYTSCSIGRKLHCWGATLSFIPFGDNQGFNFHIGVNSSMLQDLKYEKRTSSSDYPNWY